MSRPRQTLELVLDPKGEAAVRAVWQCLSQAGLPSLHDHRSSSNRPHLTLVTAPEVTPEQEQRLAAAVGDRLPIRTTWGAVTTFGHGPYAVVRLVHASLDLPDLLALQHDLSDVLDLPDLPENQLTAPARWTPHVSFAVRVPADQRDAVIAGILEPGVDPVLDPGVDPDQDAVLTWVAARRWDPVARREWSL